MKILNIKIEDFGCLSGRSFDLSPAFNLAVGDNESGKSTLLAFIKFIFYGLPRKTQENLSERERSFSWKANSAAGSITFSTDDGKTYTVERRSMRRAGEKRESVSDSLRIIDEESGKEVHKGEVPGEIFLGVPSGVFESTCFIRQSGVTNINTADLGSALENILLSADESLNLQRSLDRLDAERKLLLHKNGKGGSLYELEVEGESLAIRLSKAKDDLARILSKTDEVNERRREALEKRRELDRLDDLFNAIRKIEIIKRFDALHAEEENLASLEQKYSDFLEKNAASGGFIPDSNFVASLSEFLAALTAAKEAHDGARQILDETGTALAREENEKAAGCPLSADEIRLAGGADRLCGEIEELFANSTKKKKLGKTMLLPLALGFSAAAVLAALSFIITMPALLYAAALPLSVAVISAFIKGGAAASSERLYSKADTRLTELGVPPSVGFTDTDRITLLHANITSLFERETRLRALENDFALARSTASLREKDLLGVTERAEALLGKWKRPFGDTEGAIKEAIIEARGASEEKASILAEITASESKIEALKNGLEDENEADLRARVSSAAVDAYEAGDAEEIIRRRKFTSEALRSLNERLSHADRELMMLENESEKPSRLSVLIEENAKKYESEKLKFDAVVMAQTALTEAGNDLRSTVSPALRAKAEQYMSALTNEKYNGVGIGADYSMTARTDDSGSRSVGLLSAGTQDVAYLALRLSLLEVIFGEERPFLAVDEALAQLDDKRASAALSILASFCESGGQCLLFTCHTREEKLIEGITEAKVIKM